MDPHGGRPRTLLGTLGSAATWPTGIWRLASEARHLDARDVGGPEHSALLLGCTPGPRLRRRADVAAALVISERAGRVVVSGAGEAVPAANQLRFRGVPEGRIVLEPHARSTWDNLRLARPFLGPGPVWIVSDRWHLPRAMAMARRLDYTPLPAPVNEEPQRLAYASGLAREVGAVLRAALLDRL